MEDALYELSNDELRTLLKQYDDSESVTARGLIKTLLYIKKNNVNFNVKAYVPHKQTDEGLFVVSRLTDSSQNISIFSTKKPYEVLFDALKMTKIIDWTIPTLFCVMSPTIVEHLAVFLKNKHVNFDTLDSMYLFHLSDEKAKIVIGDLIIPSDVTVKPLLPEHAKTVADNWPHRKPDSDQYFNKLIDDGIAIGIHGRENDDLRGWSFLSIKGDIHSLYVLDEYRGKKYAQILIKSMIKILLESKIDIYSFIIKENEASIKLFSKLGFENVGVLKWIYTT